MPDSRTPQDKISLAVAHLSDSYPTELAGANVGPMNWWDKLTAGGAQGVTSPFGHVGLNLPDGIEQPQVDDLLAHELTHVKQNQSRGVVDTLKGMFFGPDVPYMDRPDEKEAYGVQRQREWKRGDINLPVSGLQGAMKND